MNPQTHYKQLDYQERETIALGIETGLGMRAIGRMLGRPASAISHQPSAGRLNATQAAQATAAATPSNAVNADAAKADPHPS